MGQKILKLSAFQETWFRRPSYRTGIFTENDLCALRVLSILRELAMCFATIAPASMWSTYTQSTPSTRWVTLAKSLQGSRTQLLGVLVSDVSNSFFADLSKQIEAEARKYGYSMILFNSDRRGPASRFLSLLS